MDRHPQSTRDVIHVSLERLGYTGEVFQAVRIWSGSVGVQERLRDRDGERNRGL